MQRTLGCLLLIAAITPGAAEGAEGDKDVRIGLGCIAVPASYRVVELPRTVVDHHHGFVTAPGRAKVKWSFGFGEAHPGCEVECKSVWSRQESIGGRTVDVGLLEDGGKRVLFIVDELISFRVDADASGAPEHIRDIVARYHHRAEPERCQAPEAP
jgi:hypothetical protein